MVLAIDVSTGLPMLTATTLFDIAKDFVFTEEQKPDLDGIDKILLKKAKALQKTHGKTDVVAATGRAFDVLSHVGAHGRELRDLIAGQVVLETGTTNGTFLIGRAQKLSGNSLNFDGQQHTICAALLTALVQALKDNSQVIQDAQAALCRDFGVTLEALDRASRVQNIKLEKMQRITEGINNLRRLQALEPLRNNRIKWQAVAGKVDILLAQNQIVPVFGRNDELDDLQNWCEKESSIAVRTYYGEGGTGKTRLLIEAIDQQGRSGDWACGFLSGYEQTPSGELATTLKQLLLAGKQLLIVVDYADGQTKLVSEILSAARQVDVAGFKLRLVLLARQGGSWRKALTGTGSTLLQDGKGFEFPLQPLGVDEQARQAYFDTCFNAFSQALQHDEALPQNPDLSAKHFENALLIAMAALATVHGEFPASLAELFDGVVERERRLWRQRYAALPADGLEALIVLTTLTQGAVGRGELKILARIALAHCEREGTELDQLADAVQSLYPPEQPSDGTCAPLRPDRVGEWLIKQALKDDEKLLTKILKTRDGEGRHVADVRRIEPLLTLDRASQWLPILTPAVALETSNHLKKPGTSLLGFAARVSAILSALVAVSDDENILPAKAQFLINQSIDLAALGQSDVALIAVNEAVEIRRELVARNPNAYLPNLANGLSNLSTIQSSLGQHDAALEAVIEAVEIYRKLGEHKPDAYMDDLAMSLNNLGNRLSSLRRFESALGATNEAVCIYRKLAQQNPDAYLPDLAISLNNLGAIQSALGRHDAALDVTNETVDIRRKLVEQNPDAYLPDLAASFNNLGNRLSALGRLDMALESVKKAVEIRRKLVEQSPDAYLPHLATSLGVQGSILRESHCAVPAGKLRPFRGGMQGIIPLAFNAARNSSLS